MPPEQQSQISVDGGIRRESLASRRESLEGRRESIFSRRESLFSRKGSLIGSQYGVGLDEGKILGNGTSPEEDQVAGNEMEVIPEPEPLPLSPEEEKRLREEEEQIRKKIAIEMRKAELRAKMEEASKARRAKKGFMTPERKKKLRLLLRRKAAEELRKEQERKANERRWIIQERCGEPEDLEWASKDDLIDICEDYFQRIIDIESDKWDLEFEIRKQTFEITELTQKVSDLRGKFQRPVLKKVSKYENKFAKLQRKAAEYNFRSQLKIVRRPDYKPKEEEKRIGDKITEDIENADKTEETEETNEGVAEGSDRSERSERSERSSLKDEEGVEPSKHEGDIGSLGSGAEVEDYIKAIYTGRSSQEGSRLEGEPRLEAEEGTVPEGDAREGGQSPEFQGEAQPSEFSEGSEPPPPPQPQHTPDDLWDYLKETVSGSGEHPATVEEFVQKLIGTLEHVPEEYLKPVIDFNVKRATSPSVTDGDHLDAKYRDNQSGEGDHGIEQTVLGEVHLQANGEVALEGEGESSVTEGDVFPSKESPALPETTSNIPEDPSESTGGYSALEAPA